jgi:hypothetical protein
MAVVYRHTHDDGTIFYIGIGKRLKRAYTKDRRSPIWKYAVNKYGLNVEVLHDDVSWEDACKIEMDLIKQYGRKAFGEGTLVNLTEGGDGQLGLKASEETKQKMSESHMGLNTWSKGRVMSEEEKQSRQDYMDKHVPFAKGHIKSEETKRRISEKLKGRKPNYLGCKHTEEQRKKISDSKKGEKHHLYGKTHSEDTKQKMRESALRVPKITCPHCNKIGNTHNMVRWHFDNCKTLKQII